jgi:hypothetical protein
MENTQGAFAMPFSLIKKKNAHRVEEFQRPVTKQITQFQEDLLKNPQAVRDSIRKQIDNNEIDQLTLSMNIFYMSSCDELITSNEGPENQDFWTAVDQHFF